MIIKKSASCMQGALFAYPRMKSAPEFSTTVRSLKILPPILRPLLLRKEVRAKRNGRSFEFRLIYLKESTNIS